VLFVFYTIFPNPLRLYEGTMHAGIVAPEEVRELSDAERSEVERFIADFTARGAPIRRYRAARATLKTGRDFVRHVLVRATQERDNEYLVPGRYVANYVRENLRAAVLRRYYEPVPTERPFVYFPLHVTDDYKIKRVIPHCVDQAALIEQVADALPQGHEVVIKEHPLSIGRNSIGLIHRLTRRPNIRLVEPRTSSHELIRRATAIVVISSTVGLEALLYGRPVLTLGQPFYSGYGVTLDVDSFRELRAKVIEVLDFHPDRERILRFLHAAMRSCFPGAPVAIDPSEANARRLAASLDAAARGRGAARGPDRAVAAPAAVAPASARG
jgi:Capsule polysaccharide biosynthesis protein